MIRLELITAIGTSLAAVAAFTAVGYYAGKDTVSSENAQLKDQIELFKAANETKNVLTFLEDIKSYNEKLFHFEEVTRKILDLEDQVEVLRERNGDLNIQVDNKEARVLELQGQIEILNENIERVERQLYMKYAIDEEVNITEGQAHTFSDIVTVGVRNVYSGRVVATVLGGIEFIAVGEQVNFDHPPNTCQLTLIGVYPNTSEVNSSEPNYARFTLKCSESTLK